MGVAALTLGVVVVNGINIVDRNKDVPPIKVVSATALNKEVEFGGKLSIVLTIDKNRDCPATYQIWFESERGDVKTSKPRRGNKFPIGVTPKGFEIDLPQSVHTGKWDMVIIGYLDCPHEARQWVIRHPPIPFSVVRKET
ncbi:MAG: hypothetical protein ACR2RE_13000 [Geminicoccaceae bacterium]